MSMCFLCFYKIDQKTVSAEQRLWNKNKLGQHLKDCLFLFHLVIQSTKL